MSISKFIHLSNRIVHVSSSYHIASAYLKPGVDLSHNSQMVCE